MSVRAHHRNVSGNCAIEAITNGIHLVFGLWSSSPGSFQSSPGPPGSNSVHASPNISVGHGIPNTTYPPTFPSPPVTSHIPNISGNVGSSTPLSNAASANMSATSPALTNDSTHPSLRPCGLATWIMRKLEKGARIVYPLHSVARTILDGCEIFEAAHINAEAYETMASELKTMAVNLKRHMQKLNTESSSGDIAQIEESIQRCSSHIDQQRIRNRRTQIFESGRDQEDIVNSRHKVESIYRGVQAIASEAILNRTGRQLEDVLLRKLGHVEDARFNSDFAPQIRRRGCTPGTRIGIQDSITAWTGDPESKRLWIHGGPGTGKTTIAYTTCERLQKENALGASYFCTRTSSECGNLRRLIPTIAYQLATHLPVFQSALCTVLEKQRDCPSLEPQWQFYWLLSEPLQAIRNTVSKDLVVVIDGIDECEDHYFMQQVLGQILNHHFGGRSGRTTTDALHLLTKTIKDAWATKKVASALYLDVKGAFPHANPLRLAENMRELGVPTVYVNWMLAKLSGRTTCLAFDDFTSDLLPIDNGIDQGCPLSVIFYLLYNAPLVKIPRRAENELCIAYIDDVTFITWGPTFEDNHRVLVDMMTRRGGALEWSDSHNSTFELDKTACVDFAPSSTSKRLERPPLKIRDQVITPAKSHTLLGVIMDQTLSWREQCDKALAKGQNWAGQLNRLVKMSYGTSVETAKRLYTSIAIPRFTYAADVWFTPITSTSSKKRTGSVGFANRLARIQSTAARSILGAMRSTPVASLDAHLDLLPMHLLMNETCQRAAIRLAAVPTSHPLHKAVAKCATGRKKHRPPLQAILRFAGVKPTDFELAPLNRRSLPSTPPAHHPDRDTAAAAAWNDRAHLLVFADATAGRAGVAAAAILWESGGRELRTGLKLGDLGSLSILDAEVVAIALAAHLVTVCQEDTIVDDVAIYTDSQAAIACIDGHTEGASHKLIKAARATIRKARKGSGGTTISLKWCPGHMGVPGNETADQEASRVVSGFNHPPHLIPEILADFRPKTNPTTRKLDMKAQSKRLADAHWAATDAGAKYTTKYPNLLPQYFLAHSRGLTRSRATLLFRLLTGHVQLRQHLHRLRLVDSPLCEHCGRESETVTHFLLRCPCFATQRQEHLVPHGVDFLRMSFLLHAPSALVPLFDYVKATGRFSDLVR